MPWYFAGPDAKPVGPLSFQELQDRRNSGALTSDTYIIEHTGVGTESVAWKRYKDVFPPNLPATPAAPVLSSAPKAMPHPLFPSGGTGAYPVHYQAPLKTDGWCSWGFALSLLGFFLSFACGTGLLLALPAFVLCIIGLVQVRKNSVLGGQGLAVAGLVLSSVAVFISLIVIAALAVPMWRAHESTVTEQTSNDSD